MQVSLERWRSRIDALDRQLLELLNERAQLALAFGCRKRTAGKRACA